MTSHATGNTISLMKWINLSFSKGHWGIGNVCFIVALQIENIPNNSTLWADIFNSIKFILFNKYLLNAFYAPGTFLGGETKFYWGKSEVKQVKKKKIDKTKLDFDNCSEERGKKKNK